MFPYIYNRMRCLVETVDGAYYGNRKKKKRAHYRRITKTRDRGSLRIIAVNMERFGRKGGAVRKPG